MVHPELRIQGTGKMIHEKTPKVKNPMTLSLLRFSNCVVSQLVFFTSMFPGRQYPISGRLNIFLLFSVPGWCGGLVERGVRPQLGKSLQDPAKKGGRGITPYVEWWCVAHDEKSA